MSDQLKSGDRSDAIGLIANTLTRLGFLEKPSDLFDWDLTAARLMVFMELKLKQR